ncbi:calmodulin 7-2 (macronuclear) [Tetrahymena thermophila SB210]|uniref:Calmodulin n=1 Tax=Tetrahymena thermophila (strain SB210) TaxID=312017 RepID=I7MDA9_TETTS|nr:calmodulin 7-2 [Tetrahymena thermophila SB210]8TH8_Q Chain Q, Calmodulin 7-2 [Tetrahymena thermophila]8TH8_R Chain R, Calmodulin 7-2 [Tetrahymena thermophila]8TID_Q Chain Q, Calmodulin 7-2 [Tetrahymena thermophila]8TID_R Chain R, Calmodulin 7-2 [Tetrahymena thermophila]EAR86103.1 calmodulin 7-2 [Tetrahymena thermophila SB210]|eukprot:XP_976698.1 calmodulin 7-2 [Tetrahymena thermophila SB210]
MDNTGKLEKQLVTLNDGLPKKPAKEIIEELKHHLYQDFQKFFSEEKKQQYQNNFALFDRDNDKYINLSELKELLTSVNITFPDDELEELYNEFCLTSPEADGINEDAVFIIVSKKIRDNDKDEQLTQAFKLVEKAVNDELAKTPNETKEQEGYIRVEQFKELLMTLGNRWSEEQANEFLKDINPKSDERINYLDVVKKLMKR